MKHATWLSAGLTIGAVAFGLALSAVVAPHAQVIFSVLVVSVLVSAWYGGLLMGLAATVLSVVGGVAVSRLDFNGAPLSQVNAVNLVAFAVIGAVVSAFADRRRRQQLQL